MLNAELCFSSVFFLMTTGQQKPSNVAIASLKVDTDHGAIQVHDALVDTGGSKNLASRHLLKNIKLAKSYGSEPIRMVTVNGLSPDYNHQDELHTTDENGTPLVILCYVQEKPIMGHDTFILLCNNTIVNCSIDMNYHARTSKEMGAVPLKRLVNAPYHYTDVLVGDKPDESPDLDFSNLAMHAAFEARAQHLLHTGKRVRRSKRSRSKEPYPTKAKELPQCSEWDSAFTRHNKSGRTRRRSHGHDRHQRRAHEQIRYQSTQGGTEGHT